MSDSPRYIREYAPGRWRVTIWEKGVRFNVGTFRSREDAEAARDAKLTELRELPAVGDAGGEWRAEGVFALEDVDEDAVLRKAQAMYNREAQREIQRRSQRLTFRDRYTCPVFTGDLHFGDPGTDVDRAFEEAQIVMDTPGMWLADLGDSMNQFILTVFAALNLGERMPINDEWILYRRYLRLTAPKRRLSVRGNHDAWPARVTGHDWFRELMGFEAPDTLYDCHDNRVVIDVGGVEFPLRMRHSWRGHSIYNLTHGIERAARFDDRDFVLGVGAHTHASGVCRQFNVGSTDCLAVLVGSYKRLDAYARECGFPRANNSTAVAVILDADTGSMTGCNNLEQAARIMRALRQEQRQAA